MDACSLAACTVYTPPNKRKLAEQQTKQLLTRSTIRQLRYVQSALHGQLLVLKNTKYYSTKNSLAY